MSLDQANRISHLIGLIYDCVVEPERWQATLDAINAEFHFLHGVLGFYQLPSGVPLLQVPAGVEEVWLRSMARYVADMEEYWGGLRTMRSFPLDEPVRRSDVTLKADILHNRFHTEWCAPQGILDMVGFTFAQNTANLGSVVFSLHESTGIASAEVLTALRLIAPHIRRAVTISNLFDLKSIAAHSLGATLETLSVGVVLIDEDLGIVHRNSAARGLLAGKGPILERGGRLVLLEPLSMNALSDAVAKAKRSVIELGQRGIEIPIKCHDGSTLMLHFMPLGGGTLRPNLQARAIAAVFIAPSASPLSVPAAALELLYDLTPAETRVFELVVEGKTQAEISGHLGVAPSTIKTHLLSVFEKTGKNRQVDLVRLAASLSSRF